MTTESEPSNARPAARLLNLLGAAAEGVASAPARLAVGALTVAALVFWVVAGLAISEGLQQQSLQALDGGADLFIAADSFGSDGPVPLADTGSVAALPGVMAVVPRIVGRLQVAERWVTVVGIDAEAMAKVPAERRATMPAMGSVKVGTRLADQLGFKPGKDLLLEGRRSLVFKVEDAFAPGAGLGSAGTMLMHLEDAAVLFDDEDRVSDLLVYCQPGYQSKLATAISQNDRLRVQTRDLVAAYLGRAYTLRSGPMMLLLAMAVALGVPLFLLISDLGATGRRRELALLKACGWTTGDCLILSTVENSLIALQGGVAGVLGAFVWTEWLGAPLLRAYFVPGSFGTAGSVTLPTQFQGLPIAVALLLAVVIATTGGVLSVWRSSTVPPSVGMRG